MVDKLQQYIDNEYRDLSIEERKEIYDLYFNPETVQEMKDKLERIIFYKKPPTPEEFLDPSNGWVPKDTTENMYPWIKQEFIDILTPDPTKPIVVEYGATRIGKTFLAVHLMLYIIIFFHHLREPAMFFGKSSITELAIYIISFDYDKTKELYLNKIFAIMKKSSKFKLVKFQDKVEQEQNKIGRDVIVYSKAATTGEITLASRLQLQMGNDDALAFVGADICVAFVSELAFWIEKAGATEERVYRLYTDLRGRIKATVGRQYLSFLYLDTSANTTDSLIEKHIINELQHREYVHFTWLNRWTAIPEKDKDAPKIWHKTGQTFKVIVGAGSIPAKIVNNENDLEGVPTDLIKDIPIDYYDEFKDNLLKSIKDIAGIPTARENKFITDLSIVDRMFNNPLIENIEGVIITDSGDNPNELLWDKINSKFFNKTLDGKFKFKRAQNEIRYVGIGNAYSLKGNLMGYAIVHKEWSREKNNLIFVGDMAFALGPGDKGISLDAPVCFMVDANKYAGAMFYGIQSDSMAAYAGQKQFLDRMGMQMINHTTDKDISLYQQFYTFLNNDLIKCGRNIFLKNNLNSLIITKNEKGKEKIDHIHGQEENKYAGDFENSKCGINAKDVSDALAQAVFLAYSHDNYIPATCYEDENRRLSTSKEDIQFNVKEAYKKIHKFF